MLSAELRVASYRLLRMAVARIPRLVRPLQTHAGHTSVNPREILHFSRLSAHWWDEHGEFAFLHRMNPVRMRFITQKLLETARDESTDDGASVEARGVLRGLDVLDVGCGGGLLSESLAMLGANTTGIDASAENVAIASHHASTNPAIAPPSPLLSYLHTPAESLLASSKRYDVVCSMEVLEHVENPTSFLATCASLLKPGGHLFLSTISRTPLAYALTILLAEDILRKVSRGTHTYEKFIKASELIQYFRDYRDPSLPSSTPSWITSGTNGNLPRTQAEVRGLIYNPMLGSWHLASRDAWGATQCNYIFWTRKPQITMSNDI